jgi:hypothetical protein
VSADVNHPFPSAAQDNLCKWFSDSNPSLYSVALRGHSKRECGFLTPRLLARRHDRDAVPSGETPPSCSHHLFGFKPGEFRAAAIEGIKSRYCDAGAGNPRTSVVHHEAGDGTGWNLSRNYARNGQVQDCILAVRFSDWNRDGN